MVSCDLKFRKMKNQVSRLGRCGFRFDNFDGVVFCFKSVIGFFKKHKSTLNYPALVLKARTAAVRSRFDSGSPLFSFYGGCPLMLDK